MKPNATNREETVIPGEIYQIITREPTLETESIFAPPSSLLPPRRPQKPRRTNQRRKLAAYDL